MCSHSSCFNVESVSSCASSKYDIYLAPASQTPLGPPHPLHLPYGRSFGPQANRGFVSKWAEKLLKTSKKWFSAPDQQQQPSSSAKSNAAAAAAAAPTLPPDGSSSGLINASAASRAAAMGQGLQQSKSGGPAGGGGGGGGEAESGGTVSGGGGGGGRGGGRGGVIDPADRPHAYDADSVLALSELVGVLLRRWGTGANSSNQVMQAGCCV